MKNKKLFIGIIIGVIVITLTLSYFFILTPYLKNRDIQAVNYGIQYTVNLIANAVATCQQVPLPYGNVTINITAIECLGNK